MSKVAERLHLYRGVRGLTIREVADRAGVAFSTVYRIEQGTQKPSAQTLAALAEVLGVPFGALLGHEVYIPEEEPK